MLRRIAVFKLFMTIVMQVFAQYPVIPDSIKERIVRQQLEIDRKSDNAWKKALPIVLHEDSTGRPYRPWASKPTDLIKADIPAFPGAEGGGAYTPGGRGGKVITVTSLEDNGPGTFREACETGGARIIVFNVSGVIKLKSPISIRAPYITIAGQTAPGDGVCITGASVLLDTHDIIIRHMRFRRGQKDVAFRDDALGGNCVGNVIIDHCSAMWGLDENMSLYRHVYNRKKDGGGVKLPTVNITIQNSIFAEALDTYNHGFGATIGGHNSMFCRNLFSSNISRNSSIGMNGNFNFVNNIIFNWWNRTIDGGDNTSRINIINNYFKPGPITPKNKPIANRIIKLETGRSLETNKQYGKAFVDGNIIEGNARVTENNWDGGVQGYDFDIAETPIDQVKMKKAFNMPNVTIMNADEAYEWVLKNVGATFPQRDAVDSRVIRTVITGKPYFVENAPIPDSIYVKRRLPADSYKYGIITDPEQVGGLPYYNGVPYIDTDGDGMPDIWEKRYGLNPYNPEDAVLDCNGDGYTNIEKYINGINPKIIIDWRNKDNNYDTLNKIRSLL